MIDLSICDGNQIIIAQARVVVGNLSITTPFVQSITVSRERGTPQSRAQCTLRLNEEEVSQASAGDVIFITAYGKAWFTGVVRRIQATPTNICAGEYYLSLQCEDPLYLLENRRITRRQKLEGLGPLALISSKVDEPERGFDTPPEQGGKPNHSFFGSPDGFQTPAKTTNPRDLVDFITSSAGGTWGANHPVTKSSRILAENRGSGLSGGGLGIHDHSDLENLGPAHAVYGTK